MFVFIVQERRSTDNSYYYHNIKLISRCSRALHVRSVSEARWSALGSYRSVNDWASSTLHACFFQNCSRKL
uniref:Uncharacterized protein n=1 Tax=Triticum urartu TaxID=4572 RepID=A0A8R7TFS9_TRIUA